MSGSAKGIDTPAVIVRTHVMRESDLVVVLCTASHGKVACAARGARKSKRRFAGGLPVGARGDARISPGRGSLWTLEAFTPTADHASLGRNLERFAFANYLCELTDRLTVDLDPVPNVFAALWESLEQLSASNIDALLLRAFELRLLAYVGSLPELDRCAACGEAIDEGPVPFDALRGGALCARHGRASPRMDPVVLELAARLLSHADTDSPRALTADERVTPERRKSLRDLCVKLLSAQLNRPLRSIAFFKELERLGKVARPGKSGPDGPSMPAPAPQAAPPSGLGPVSDSEPDAEPVPGPAES